MNLFPQPFADSHELLRFVRQTLTGYLDQPGKVFYSGFETYQNGRVIFLGYNPGGNGEDTLESRLREYPAESWNHFVDERWGNRESYNRLQLRAQKLFCQLELDLRTDVFTSNVYFRHTPRVSGLRGKATNDFKEACSKVLRHFLEAVPAKIVICNGNQTFFELLYWLDPQSAKQPDYYAAEVLHTFGKRGKVYCTDRACNGRTLRIVGVPHLSWVDVAANELAVHSLRQAFRRSAPRE